MNIYDVRLALVMGELIDRVAAICHRCPTLQVYIYTIRNADRRSQRRQTPDTELFSKHTEMEMLRNACIGISAFQKSDRLIFEDSTNNLVHQHLGGAFSRRHERTWVSDMLIF